MRRAIKIEELDIELELSKVTTVRTNHNMIHLYQMIPDFSKVESFKIIRED